MTTFTRPVVSAPGAGSTAFGFGPHLIRMSAAETADRFGMFEADIPVGGGPPLHVHAREDEFFRVLSGRFLFVCDDECTELAAGGCILLPRGVPHRFQNVGTETGRLMVVVTPGGFEGFFAAVDRAAPEEIGAIAARYGVRFIETSSSAQAA